MPYYSLTFNPQISETNLLEEYLILLKPFIENFPKYTWAVEKDKTLSKHLHLLIFNEAQDGSANFWKKFKTNTFRQFFKNMTNMQTVPETFLHCSKVKNTPQDLMYAIGYVNKEHFIRGAKKGFTDQEILDGIEYYWTKCKIDKVNTIDTNWKIVTLKNAHVLIEEFCERENLSLDHPFIKLKMTQSRYTFSNIPEKTIDRIFRELRIFHKCSDQSDEQRCNLEANGMSYNYDYWTHENCEELVEFIRSVNTIEPDEVPQNITNLLKKYLK